MMVVLNAALKVAFAASLILLAHTNSMAAPKSPKLAKCDGKHRRPANIYGSILPTVDPARGSVSSGGALSKDVNVFPKPERGKSGRSDPAPPVEIPAIEATPLGATTPPQVYGSC